MGWPKKLPYIFACERGKMKKIIGSLLLFVASLALGQNASTPPNPSPSIVSKVSFLNQVGPISNTTLFTPAADGDFRISAYVVSGYSVSDGSVCFAFDWTDNFRSNLTGTCIYSNQPIQYSNVFHAISGQPIYITNGGTTDATHTYSEWVTLEQE
jgi:hypothetical protein